MQQTLTDSELSAFAQQLAMILHSGISVLEGISILCEDTSSENGKQLLEAVYEQLELTGDFTASLQETSAFPDYFLKMTGIGERSGTLEDVMDSLAVYYDRQTALMRSIRESLTYPLILLGMLLAVLLVLMTQVMPVFEEVFLQLGIEMTGISSTVFHMSHGMQTAAVIALFLVVLTVLGCMLALRSAKSRTALLALLLHLPIVRTVSNLLACSHFSGALSLALHSGLDMGESFTLAAGLTRQPVFQEKLQKAGELMEQGNEFGESLRDAGIFTGLNARLISIGFRTGTAETALKKLSEDCQTEADLRIQSVISTLEPTLTAVLSILTGLILVSVMLPLLSVMTTIG